MKKTKPCSRKEHNGEVRGSVLRKAYQVRKTSNFIFFFLHKENVKKTEKGKYVFLLHVLKIHRPGKWYIIACFLYLRFDWLGWNLIFLRRIMEFLSKYQKKKGINKPQCLLSWYSCHTVMSYSLIFFLGSSQLLILRH